MPDFITFNAGTFIVLLAVAALVFAIVRSMRRDLKKGKHLCGGNCQSCGGACSACSGCSSCSDRHHAK